MGDKGGKKDKSKHERQDKKKKKKIAQDKKAKQPTRIPK